MLEQRNDSFKESFTQSQARSLQLEQDKVELTQRTQVLKLCSFARMNQTLRVCLTVPKLSTFLGCVLQVIRQDRPPQRVGCLTPGH